MKCLRILGIASCLLAFAHLAYGQQSVDLGSISGRVADPTGAVVPGADVSARQTQTNVTAHAVTDREGRFRFPYLKLGPYEVIVSLQGFKTETRKLTLGAGSAFELPVSLVVGEMGASVTVSAETVLESARSQIAGTVSQIEVQNLPLNGRNFLELALLVPGVSPTNVNSSQLFPETSAVPGVTLSVGSQRNMSNNFIVDGLSANDDAAGLSGMTYGVDAVGQFQVVTSGGQAELGRALGGYVNMVTRSGTNVTCGTAYNFFRDDALNAKNALSGAKLPMRQWQYGASLGGPIVVNRTFYFANVEQRRLDQTVLVTISAANVETINSRLAAVGYRGPALVTGLFNNPVDTTNILAKIDHQAGTRDQISLRYSRYHATSTNARGAGGLSAPSASSNLDNVDHSLAASNTLTLSSRTVLETRAQFGHGNLAAPPSDAVGPAVSIAGVATFGRLSSSPTARVNRLYQIVNNLSYQTGAHALRVGADVLYNSDDITFPRANQGSYTFSSLANFLIGAYNNAGFAQTFGAMGVSQNNTNLGVYVQDEWKAAPTVTVNLGVRYDLQWLKTIATDTDNVSPRLGVAWTPFASGRSVVRGSVGLFYDRVPMRALANALLSAGNTTDLANLRQVGVSLSPTQAGAPVFPNVLASVVPSVTLANLTTMDPHLQNASSRQASVEFEHQLDGRTTVSVGYSYVRGQNLLMSINQNVPTCAAAGANNGCRPVSAYANNSQYSSVGRSNYHGLQVALMQRPTGWGHYRVSYTLSKSMNNVGEFFFSGPIDPFDISKDWGRSDDDQRHRLAVSAAVQARGFQLSGLLQTYSALPLNITSGVTTVQGTAGRPIVNGQFIERNAGTGADFLTLNLRLARTFHVGHRVELETMAEGFNLTNRRNVVTWNANFGSGAYPASPSSTFRQATAVGEPRSLQFGARIRF